MLNAKNWFKAVLISSIDSSQTTIETDTSDTPAVPFRVVCDYEIMEVTAVDGTTWTVTRGVEGTTPTSHNQGAVLVNAFTAGMYNEIKNAVNNIEGNIDDLNTRVIKLFPPAIPKDSIAYFKKQLIDELIGIKPEGYDSSTITAYGLRTSSDGTTLVVIECKDDVLFPGVTSFAVEEGTTNLVNVDLTAWSKIYASVATVSDVQSPIGTTVYKISDDTTNATHVIDSNSFTVDTNAVLTFSLYAKAGTARYILLSWGQDSNYNNGHSGNPCFDLLTGQWQWNASNHGEFSAQYVGNGWWRLMFTVTNTSGTTFSDYVQIVTAQSLSTYTYAGTRAYFYVTGVQVEQKPFATPFVDGTRPHGIVKLTNPPLPLDNFVINLWFKPTQYPSQTNRWWRLFGVSYKASAYQGLELCAPPSDQEGIPSNTLSLTLRSSLSTFVRYNLGFDLSAEIGKWHMITLISNGSIVDVYIDGEKRVSATNDIQRSAIEFVVFGRWFANISGTGQENGFLMSNLLFASYDPATWTDEYIRFLYETQKPFFV